MSEIKDTSLFTEITAEESASVNGGHYYGRDCYRPRPRPCRPRPRPCRNYGYSPYFDGRQVSSYVHNSGYRGYYN